MCQKLNGATVGEENFKLEAELHRHKGVHGGGPRNEKPSGKPKLTARSFGEKVRISVDVGMARRLVKHLDLEKGIVTNPAVICEEKKKKEEADDAKEADKDEGKKDADLSSVSPSVCLDRMISYLRRVHLYEYYAGEEFMEESELERKHPGGYCRNLAPAPERNSYRETKQEGQLDSKLRARLDRKFVLDLRMGEIFIEKQIESWFEAHTIKKADNKFGTDLQTPNVPVKLFREPKFVHKHIVSKHGVAYEEQLTKLKKDLYFHNYFSDPGRVRPAPPPGAFPNARALPGRDQGRGYGGGGGGGGREAPHFSPRMRGRSPPRGGRGRSPPGRHPREERGSQRDGGRSFPPAGSAGRDPRSIRSYNDLDGATDDLQPIDFDDMESLVEADPLGL